MNALKPKNQEKNPPIIEATMSIMSDLIVVMTEELALLQKINIAGIQDLMRRKTRLFLDYQANMKSIAAQPDIMTKLSVETRAKLKDLGVRLAEVAARNAAALKAAALATEKLLRNIIRAVREQKLPKQTYTNPRHSGRAFGGYSPTCRPVAVNRTA